jgi:GTP-binding protein HflX
VGFIQKLPTQLVAAFRATLEEMEEATLLLHVIDITHSDAERQAQTVEETLADLGLQDRPRITVLNKADLWVEETRNRKHEPGERRRKVEEGVVGTPEWAGDAIVVSAARGWGLDGLRERIEEELVEADEREARATSDR